ncbi:protein NEDD1 isoform X2 [Rhipicephalus sanguineus]|uniref:protein NEDD1 isoform X2 n=1 Tax=Rhipicephalus sanguineus TaxID=34632 RepID=UPI00189463C3|nr:protein NEDD1 isoform X2 [Rhipicephalus sanguineus]
MFATAGEDVQLWCSSTVQPCLRFDVDESRVRTVTCVSWSADGRRLASISQYCDFVNVTEFTGTEHAHTRVKVEGPCYCCAFSPNDSSSSLCVGLVEGGVQLLRNGKTYYSYKPHKEKVTCVSYNNNGSFVASGAYDGSVALLSVDTKVFRDLSAPTGKAVVGLQWSNHNRFKLVTTSMDGYLCIWDSSARCLRSKHAVHPTQGSSCLSLSAVNESLAVTAGHDRHLVLFDMLTTSELASVETPETFESVAFLPDGHRLLAGGTSGRLYLYDLRNTRQMPPSTFDAHSRPLLSIATMQSPETEMQMMTFVNACAVSMKEAASTPRQPQCDTSLPIRFSLGPDVQAAGDLVKTSTPDTATVWARTKDFGRALLSPNEVFKEAHQSSILDRSWTSPDSSAIGRHGRIFRLSDYMPVLSDSVLASASCASPLKVVEEVEEEVAVEEESQAPAALLESHHINGIEGSTQHASASSNSVPSTPKECSKDQHVEGAAAMDAERLLDDSAQAERVHHLENMLLEQTRYLDHQFRRIDRNMIHMHVQLTMMQHSCMPTMQQGRFLVLKKRNAEINAGWAAG